MTVRQLHPQADVVDVVSSVDSTSRAAQGLSTLEALFQELQGKKPPARLIHAALAAVAEGIGAEVVFWYPGAEGEALELVADRSIAPQFCQDFAQMLLKTTRSTETSVIW